MTVYRTESPNIITELYINLVGLVFHVCCILQLNELSRRCFVCLLFLYVSRIRPSGLFWFRIDFWICKSF